MSFTAKAALAARTTVGDPAAEAPGGVSDLTVHIGAGRDAPARARRDVKHFLRHPGHADLADAAVLVVSELVTNAVEHGRPPVRVNLTWVDDGAHSTLRLDVHDQGRIASYPAAEHADDDAESGRGLFIVDHLAVRWGLTQDPVHGTHAWAEIMAVADER
ncbi:ATP-binding protein [Nocardiopsis sp. NPDC050513]|uniref:ATP-binding protein n=1 Tax=Nocardiopsis sp. NPDC050513 TaxID=3364338 RepID=UPI0037A90482